MNRAPFRILIPLLALLFLPFPLPGQEEEDAGQPVQVAGELELEKAIAERLEEILRPLVGEVIVLVDLSLSSLPVELEGFTYSQSQSLPGLPVSISENVRKLGGGGYAYNEVGGISIRVFVNEDTPEEELDRITDMIPRWINLNYARGDQIVVERVPLIRPPLTMIDFLFTWQGAAVVAGVIIVTLGLVAVLVRALTRDRFQIEGQVVGSGGGGSISGPLSPASMADALAALESGEKKGQSGEERDEAAAVPRSQELVLPDGALSVRLVQEGSSGSALGALARLSEASAEDLETMVEDLEPTTVAVALNLARPGVAAQLLARMEGEHRRGVLDAWRSLDRLSTAEASEQASLLRKRLDRLRTAAFTVSGPEPVAEAINRAPDRTGRLILEDLRALDPELAQQVRDRVFFLDDLLERDPRALRRALMSVPREQLAALIVDASEEVRQRVFDSLSARAANLLREESSLMGSPSPERIAAARRALSEAVTQAEKAAGRAEA